MKLYMFIINLQKYFSRGVNYNIYKTDSIFYGKIIRNENFSLLKLNVNVNI